jgi:hypothetical protein
MSIEFLEIGPEEKFYGYIIGLGIERSDDLDDSRCPDRMFARFEYGGKVSIYEVPDSKLFAELAKHLVDNAVMRDEHGDYGYAKLVIKKVGTQWNVDLP